jgi:NAD/NADP transhydrogenase beta subunit
MQWTAWIPFICAGIAAFLALLSAVSLENNTHSHTHTHTRTRARTHTHTHLHIHVSAVSWGNSLVALCKRVQHYIAVQCSKAKIRAKICAHRV